MGALLDAFDRERALRQLVFKPREYSPETSRLDWRGYQAGVTRWQDEEWRWGVSFFNYRLPSREITGLMASENCDRDFVENAALDAIRADIVKVEFMEEGPAKLAKLEGEVAALRGEIAALQYDIKAMAEMIRRVSVFGSL